MDIRTFAKQVNNLSNNDAALEKAVRSIIKTTYVPIADKFAMLYTINSECIRVDENSVSYIDVFRSRVMYTVSIASLYTNLELIKTADNKIDMFTNYDLLISNHILDYVLAIIGKAEVTELSAVNNAVIDTLNNQNCSLQAYMNRVLNRILTVSGSAGKAILENVTNYLSDDKNKEKIVSLFKNNIK